MKHIVVGFVATLALALLIWPSTTQAEELLRRSPGSWLYGPTPMWTVGSTTTTTFFALSEPMRSSDINLARFAWQMTNDSGDCKLRGALRYSNDGVNWDSAKQVDNTYATDNQPVWKTTYIDLTSLGTTPRAWVQFGLETVNRSTTSIALCNGTLRVEPKEN